MKKVKKLIGRIMYRMIQWRLIDYVPDLQRTSGAPLVRLEPSNEANKKLSGTPI